jgi:phytoene synthase
MSMAWFRLIPFFFVCLTPLAHARRTTKFVSDSDAGISYRSLADELALLRRARNSTRPLKVLTNLFLASHPSPHATARSSGNAHRPLNRRPQANKANMVSTLNPEFQKTYKRKYVQPSWNIELPRVDHTSFDSVYLDAEKYHQVRTESYRQCEKITESASKTFSLASKILEPNQQKAVSAIYAWCRRTDDIVDSPRAMMNSKLMMADLTQWRARLFRIWEGEPEDILDIALLDTKQLYPELEIQPFLDMIDGMVMDTPQLGQDRYDTWDDLYLYCYRVASTVGLMTLPVMGTAPGYTLEQAKKPAIALGIGLQITNILRDVGEDAARGRIYLPREDMERFGVTEAQILNHVIDDNYVNLIKFEIERARQYYKEAQEGIPMLAPASRLGVQAASDVYGAILEKLEQNGYDNFSKRAFVPRAGKFATLISSWWSVAQMK